LKAQYIAAVISYLEHTGNYSTFLISMVLVVGQNFKDVPLPGKAKDPDLAGPDSDTRAESFGGVVRYRMAKIGRLCAMQYSGAGWFCLLDTRGHPADHRCGSASLLPALTAFHGRRHMPPL